MVILMTFAVVLESVASLKQEEREQLGVGYYCDGCVVLQINHEERSMLDLCWVYLKS